ncbi:MAG: transposase [Patescibacteria group bacterium]
MPERKTRFYAGGFYHVFDRGNNKGPIFFEDRDYERFLEKVSEYKETYSAEILAYCFLFNHFHFLVRQTTEMPINRFFGTLLNSHARYTGIKHGTIGHVFQGRFKAKLIEEEASVFQVSRYIHLNPIKERLLTSGLKRRRTGKRSLSLLLKQTLREYPWSSYPTYLNPKAGNEAAETGFILNSFGSPAKYRRFVEADLALPDIEQLSQTS